MQTFVTGATGLIGNAIARALVARGDEVRALVRDVARARQILPESIHLVEGDITDAASLPAAMDGVEMVFHAAGMPEQWAFDPTIFDDINRGGTANVLDAARSAGARRVVYTSTMDVFREGTDGKLRETEVDPDPKPSTYERSKQAAELEVDRARDAGLDVVVLNPSSVYGPSPVRTGMNEFFIRLLNGKAPMVPPGGASVTYVDTLATAHLNAGDRGVSGERYLIADAHVSMREFAEVIVRIAGLKKTPPTAPAFLLKSVAAVSAPLARTFGFKPMIARDELGYLLWNAEVDATKAREHIGYEPMPLDEGVQRTVEHLRATGLAPR